MEIHLGSRLVVIAGLASMALACGARAGDAVMYVDDDAPSGGDGATWETAYRFLADGMAAAAGAGAAMDLHLAEGTYLPDRDELNPLGTGDRFATFQLATGVRVLGGYAGLGGADPDVRDVDAFVTVLSGDLSGDDEPGFVNNAENGYHVVTGDDVDDSAVLDGLTITAGNADGELDAKCFGGPSHGLPCEADGDCPGGHCVSPDSTGAGLLCVAGRPTINNCRIAGNFARFQGAGAMLKAGSDLIIVATTFSGNRALDNGGAMYLGGSSPIVIGCDFLANSGGEYAGASCNRDNSDAQFIDCLFSENTAAETGLTGGGAIVNASSSPTFGACTFLNNTSIAGNGGAMYNKRGFHDELGPSRPTVENSLFAGNQAAEHGGAIYSIEESVATLSGTTLSTNEAERGGAIYAAEESSTDLSDCDLYENSAMYGGGMYNEAGATAAIDDSSIGGNIVDGSGAGLYNAGFAVIEGGSLTVNQSGSRGGAIYNSGALLVNDAVIGGNNSGGGWDYGGGGLYDGGAATLTGVTFTANATTGSGGGVFFVNPDGRKTPVVNCTFDGNTAGIGGGGISGACSLVDCVFTQNEAGGYGGALDGSSYSVDDTTILVASSTFTGNVAEYGGAVFVSSWGVTGAELTISDSTFTANTADPAMGGAIEIDGATATITNCQFDQNVAWARGGAVSIDSLSDATVVDCTFRDNWANNTGGAVRVASQSIAEFTRCLVQHNLSTTAGAIYIHESWIDATDCRIIGNAVAEWGGAVYAAFSDFVMTNCEVSGNFASQRAGGIYLFRSEPRLTNCTITENRAGDEGGGIFNQVEGNPIITNCILWGNSDSGPTDESAQITHMLASASVVQYSCVQGWTGELGGDGNIDGDPMLVDSLGPDGEAGTGDEDLRLAPGSPCIDAAGNYAVPSVVTTDLAGDPRFVDDPETVDTGFGEAPIVDMGALEVQVAGCSADLDGDGAIGFFDLLLVLFAWGPCGECPEDIDGNGVVAFEDLLAVLFAWGECG